MNNNDVLRSLQSILKLSETSMVEIYQLAQHKIDEPTISSYLKTPDEIGYMACQNNLISLFLDGLITLRRGPDEKKSSQKKPPLAPLSNNVIFKKLRIAFDLKEEDFLELMYLASCRITKNEFTSILRKPGNKHYRECSDELLMGFLTGLAHRTWN
ncbi:MAG: DUF1456 family protein [Gallionellaceae bacterium]